MRKRILSILLSVCMALTLLPTAAFAGTVTNYGIWVGSTEVTSANMNNVLGDTGTPTVIYDADQNILTLNNANITTTKNLESPNDKVAITRDLSSSLGLNINLIGNNTIDLSSVNIGIYGVYGINHNQVNIQSTTGGSLSIIGPSQINGYICGISSTHMKIENCTVTVTTGNSTGDSCVGIAIPLNGSLSIKNATVTATAGDAKVGSHGIQVNEGSLSIEHSTVTANGRNSGNSAYGSYGIITLNDTSTTISASTVTATGKTSALWFHGATNAPVAPTATGHTATASANTSGEGATVVPLDANVYGVSSTYKFVQIAPAPPTQARWGEANNGAAPGTWVGSDTLDAAMAYANGLTSGTAYIQLQSDVDITEALDFAAGKTTILDLNGKKIDRGLTTATLDGIVINVSGSLTLKDSSTVIVANQGKITGGYSRGPGFTYAYNSGCVGVNAGASFTMQGGNITGNKTTNSGTGGGVYVKTGGSFMMTGGSIAGNEAKNWGGGVYMHGSFTMLGGNITGNKSLNGGVYFDTTSFTVGGTAVIDDNQTTDATPVERNVVRYGYPILVHSTTPLTTGAYIGVTANTAPTSSSPVNVTGTNSSDSSSYFHSDNSSYMIQKGASNIVQLAVAAPVIGPLTISNSFTAGSNLTLSALDSYKPTITNNGVTITAQGWQTPNGLGEWTKWSEGFIPLDTSGTYKLRYYVDYTSGAGPSTVYSNAVTLNVVGKTTVLALTAAPESPQDTGTPITLTATLTGFFAGFGVSEQAITFKNGTTTLGTASLNSGGVASYIWTPSGADSYSLTAEYAATDYNKAATSNALNYTVNAALPTAAGYAAGAVSGTDYVLNGTTLTINTDKGAAFWSASDTDYLNYNILLANNVDVGGFKWMPVGNASDPFTGSLDGQGHSITGLTVSADSYAGLFSHAVNATIKNLCLSGSVQISNSSDGSYGGALVAYATESTIVNCCSHTDVTATSSGTEYNTTACAGGLVGIADSATAITNCFNTGSIRATASGTGDSYAYAGGIAGDNYESNVINCYSTGSVTAATASNSYSGGVVGRSGDATVKNCYYLNGTANKGVGNVWGSVPTITGCGTIGSDKTTLTAGTADQFASAQILENYADTLLNALNGWVNDKASADYNTWQADSAGSPVNGGYPVLNAVWGSLNLTGVGCNVAFGKLTGTTDNMQYSLDGGSTWQDCAAGDTTDLTFVAGTVKVRQKDNQTNVRTVITIAAPATSNAPTLGSKTYNSVTLTAMTGYEYSKDGGATWQNSNLFASLSSSTMYSFVARIKATATALPGTISAVLNVTTNEAPSGDGGSNGGGTNTPVGTPVIVDGKTQNIGTEKKSGDSTTVTVDQSKLGTNIGGATAGSSVVVPVSENGVATASLVVKNIEDMAAKGMTLTIQTGSVAYNLNTAAIDTAALQAAFPGADMSAVPFNVTITNSSASVEGETLVLSPMSFTVTAAYGGKTVDVDAFSAYIDRVIEVTKEQAAKITTAVVVNADGSVRHVPTNVIEKDGKYYAIINSRTNSTYALIQNEVTFSDATGKWYEAAVNEMGSRKIIAGRSADLFDGGASITRAEFAAILIRALGLPADGASTFSDVPANAWYTGAAATAVKYGLAEGKGDNRFDPSAAITRQEAMLMLQRAAALTEFTGTSGDLGSFADANSVGSWAQGAAKWSVGSSLIQGSGGKLNPTANITRAESATIILRLLQKAELVDVRSKA